ncbi:MAG: hypothetical protein H6672_17715 [Anaerolineaceae bacterium]|nr:hypothetical protein [Anaerolineaceae bacterium]
MRRFSLHRARITVEQDVPDLPFPSPDELAAQNKYHEQDIYAVYADWARIRGEHIAYQRRWLKKPGRVSQIIWCAARSACRTCFIVTAWHDVNHLEQILRVLHEKQS